MISSLFACLLAELLGVLLLRQRSLFGSSEKSREHCFAAPKDYSMIGSHISR